MFTIRFGQELLAVLSICLQIRSAIAEVPKDTPHEINKFVNITKISALSVPVQVTANYTITTSIYITEPAITESVYLAGSFPAPTTTRSIYSILYPSPNASPIEITAQSQVVTSYVPEMTWCVAPALAIYALTGPPYLNSTTGYSTSYEGTGSCSTAFAPVRTSICATTLTGLGSKISVTACEQQVTFSSECGFTLETPSPITTDFSSLITPAPTVRRLFTYWLAPWQALTAGETPSDVDVKICSELDDGNLECKRYQEVWQVVVVTSTLTTERTVQISTTVTGPGMLYVETLQSTVTDTVESVDLSTVLQLETEIETESISRGKKPTATILSTQEVTTTLYITKKLKHAPSRSPAPASSPELASASEPASPETSVAPESTSSSEPISSSDSASISDSASSSESATASESDSTLWVTATSTVRVTGTITITKPRPATGTVTVRKPRLQPKIMELVPEDF